MADTLTFSLLQSPSGMTINGTTGLIEWPVPVGTQTIPVRRLRRLAAAFSSLPNYANFASLSTSNSRGASNWSHRFFSRNTSVTAGDSGVSRLRV